MTPRTIESDSDTPLLNRRHLLKGIAATGAASAAGCLGDDDDDPGDDDDTGTDDGDDGDDGDDHEPVDPDDIVEGGRLEFGLERPNIDDYDQADSSLADDSTIFNVVYDGLRVQDTEGEYFNWMAETFDMVDSNDVGVDDYADYMAEYEIDVVEGGFPIFDLEWPNTVLMHHPDDLDAVDAGDLGEGDDMRVLTRDEAADAAADGTYGSRIEVTLHDGIEFHDGSQCTAIDVVGSYDRFVESDNEGQIFDAFLHAEVTDGDDGLDFAIYGQELDAIAEAALPPTQIYPREHHDIEPGDLDPRDDGPVPIGTGPYEVAEFEEGSQLLLQRTDNYWLENVGLDAMEWWDGDDDFPEAPVIDEINVRFVPEEGGRVAGLQDGQLDITYEISADDRNAFDELDEFNVVSAVSTGFKFLQMPVEETDEGGAFADQNVRQALSHLIPRQQIVEVVDQGWGAPARVPFPEPAAGLGTMMSYDEIQQEDWAYPVEPDEDAASDYIEQSAFDPPISVVIETNADDGVRQDKMALLVDALNQSGLFDAVLETPADIGDWVTQYLYVSGSREDYAERNAAAVIGLASGFDPHGYAEALHDPGNHNICCNFFYPSGTFDFIDLLRSCRFGSDAVEDPDTRRGLYDDLWPQIAETCANTMVDFSLETAIAGPEVHGYNGYPDRRAYLSWGLYAPYENQIAYIDRET